MTATLASAALRPQAEHEARLQELRAAHAQRERDLRRRIRELAGPPAPHPADPSRPATPSGRRRHGGAEGDWGEEPSSPATPAPEAPAAPAAQTVSWFGSDESEELSMAEAALIPAVRRALAMVRARLARLTVYCPEALHRPYIMRRYLYIYIYIYRV
jgi:hypothetical protein